MGCAVFSSKSTLLPKKPELMSLLFWDPLGRWSKANWPTTEVCSKAHWSKKMASSLTILEAIISMKKRHLPEVITILRARITVEISKNDDADKYVYYPRIKVKWM